MYLYEYSTCSCHHMISRHVLCRKYSIFNLLVMIYVWITFIAVCCHVMATKVTVVDVIRGYCLCYFLSILCIIIIKNSMSLQVIHVGVFRLHKRTKISDLDTHTLCCESCTIYLLQTPFSVQISEVFSFQELIHTKMVHLGHFQVSLIQHRIY